MENKIVIIIGISLTNYALASKLYVLENGLIIQEGSYHDHFEEEGYFKDLVTSGLGIISNSWTIIENNLIQRIHCRGRYT